MPRVGGGDVDLPLLVLGPVVRHVLGVAKLLERLPEAGHVAVPEDAPHARDEALLPAIALNVLPGHEPDDGLASRQSNRRHRGPPCNTSGLVRNRLQEGSIG